MAKDLDRTVFSELADDEFDELRALLEKVKAGKYIDNDRLRHLLEKAAQSLKYGGERG